MNNYEKEKMAVQLIDSLSIEEMDTSREILQAALSYVARTILKETYDVEASSEDLESKFGNTPEAILEEVESLIEKRIGQRLSFHDDGTVTNEVDLNHFDLRRA